MDIKVSNNIAKIIFDTCGNIYFNFKGKLYDITIDGKNNLSCDETKSNLTEITKDTLNQLKQGKIKLTNGMNSLKGKAFKEYMKELDKLKEEDYDIQEDETQEEFVKTQQYFPEDFEYFEAYDKEIKEDIYEDFDNMYTGDNQYFVFLSEISTKNNLPIYEGEDSNALYETLIYNKDLSSGDLVYKTKFIGGAPIYRLRVYYSGEVAFRPIGGKETYYKFSENNNKLEFTKIENSLDTKKETKPENKSGLVVKNIVLGN